MTMRLESKLGLRSYDEYVDYCKQQNKKDMGELRRQGRFFFVEYARGEPRYEYQTRMNGLQETKHRGAPEAVLIAYEDASGSLVFGWSAKHPTREHRGFNKAVAIHKAILKARQAECEGFHVLQDRFPSRLSLSMLEFMSTANAEMSDVKHKRAANLIAAE
jgi:hypothetical protein